jgi:hypothetical protein
MLSSGMLRRVALIVTDVSEELSASFIRMTQIGELGTTLGVTRNRRTLGRITVLTRATRCNVPEDGILHSHRRENLKFYIAYPCIQHRTTEFTAFIICGDLPEVMLCSVSNCVGQR